VERLAQAHDELRARKRDLSRQVRAAVDDVRAARALQEDAVVALEGALDLARDDCAALEGALRAVRAECGDAVERLRAVDRRRERAERAHRAVSQLQAFARAGPGLAGLGPDFDGVASPEGRGRRADAARRATALLRLAEGLSRRAGGPEGEPPGGGGGPLARATDSLRAYVRAVEEVSVREFQDACRRRDKGGLRVAGEVLRALGRPELLPALFLEGHPAAARADPPAEGAAGDPARRAGALARAVAAFEGLVAREAAFVAEVVEEPLPVLAALLSAAVANHLLPVLSACLAPPAPGAPAAELESHLELLRGAVGRLEGAGAALAGRVPALAPKLRGLAPLALSEQLASHLPAEGRLLRHLQSDLEAPGRGLADLCGKGAVDAALGVFRRMLSRIVALAPDRAGEGRVQALVYPQSVAGPGGAPPTGSLCGHFAERVRLGLELAGRQARAGAGRALAARDGVGPEEAGAQAVREGFAHALVGLAMAGQLVGRVGEFLRGEVWPMAAGSPSARDALEEGYAALAGAAQAHCQRLTEAATAALGAQVAGALASSTARGDYRAGSGAPDLDRPTAGVALLCAVLRAAARDCETCLPDGPNRAAVVSSVASAALDAFEGHLGRFTYDTLGALRLKRDVREVQEVLGSIGAGAEERGRAEGLGEALGVLMVEGGGLEGALQSLGRGLRERALELVRLRDDYRQIKDSLPLIARR